MIPPPDWLPPDQSYLVAISGGRDSVALHHWLVQNRFTDLTYCHLNHGLRGAESDGDEEFLFNLLGPALVTRRVDVSELASTKKISLETAAREARQNFFAQVARETGTPRVILAHHADDQAETILFNLLRGAAGPKGMIPVQHLNSLTYLRPFLDLRRCKINEFISRNHFAFREDSSNSAPFATRNRFRNEVMPLLSEILERDPTPALIRAHQLTRDLEEIANAVLEELNLLDPKGRIHLPSLRSLPSCLQKTAIHRFLQSNHISHLSHKLVESCLELLTPEGPPSVNLPGGHRLRRKESRLFISS